MKTLLLTLALACTANLVSAAPPNLVLIFCDDLGYGDLSCYGSEKNPTPAIDALAEQGMRFTQFYSSSPVCTPSRASLMTGCYAQRVGMQEDATGHWVLIPRSRRGLDPKEVTFAEALKAEGYATACIGKWHLGDQPEHLPTRHGFDRYFGIPYSNDMQHKGRGDPPLPLMDNETVIEAPVDQVTLTRRYTQETINFIEEHRDRPFFVYLPHTFPHLPLFATKPFLEKSNNGVYGASVLEIDHSTRQIVTALNRLGLSENTLVIFTSDNGSNGRNGGSNAPLAGSKGGTMEGGMRVPFIAKWPDRIPAGKTCDELATMMDIFPTFLRQVRGTPWQSSRPIDGKDITDLLTGAPGAKTPHEAFYYYRRNQLQAVRSGDWKLHLPLDKTYPTWSSNQKTGKGRAGKLINLAQDLKESTDVSAQHPEVVTRLTALAQQATQAFGAPGARGSAQRKPRDIDDPQPQVLPTGDVLFDGTSLDAWEFPEGSWSIDKDGALTCHMQEVTDKKGNKRIRGRGYIWSNATYGNFDLTLEYKLSAGANSGVFYRCDKSDPVQNGLELQLMDNEGFQKTHGVKDARKLNGSFYDAQAPASDPSRPVGDWNHLRMRCMGPEIKFWINGIPVIAVDIDDWSEAGKNPNGSTNKFKRPLRNFPRSGHIGFQNHGQKVWFKNIRIRSLD